MVRGDQFSTVLSKQQIVVLCYCENMCGLLWYHREGASKCEVTRWQRKCRGKIIPEVSRKTVKTRRRNLLLNRKNSGKRDPEIEESRVCFRISVLITTRDPGFYGKLPWCNGGVRVHSQVSYPRGHRTEGLTDQIKICAQIIWFTISI